LVVKSIRRTQAAMHVAVRIWSGQGASELFDSPAIVEGEGFLSF
jgi:hypothetical protein